MKPSFAIVSFVHWLRFMPLLLSLIVWGSAWGAPADPTISLGSPCDATKDASIKYAAPDGNPIPNDAQFKSDWTMGNVVWTVGQEAGCSGAGSSFTFPTLTCGAGFSVTLPHGQTSPNGNCDPPTATCAGLNTDLVTITGTMNGIGTTGKFTAQVTADTPNAKPQCDREYVFHVTATGGGWGDPHITTVDGVHYDFQSAGDFTALRGDGVEIQTRQKPVATTFLPGANPYTGLATCVAIYSAVAARVGTHTVSYESINDVPEPSGLHLFVDGVEPKQFPPEGIDLPHMPLNQTPTRAAVGPAIDGRIVKSPVGGGIEIDYADGTQLVVTPAWWADQQKWYLNVNVYGTTATRGIFGKLAKDSWLPALPDGTSLGPKPESLHQRYVDLYQKFADAWRVTNDSLFKYAPGTKTADSALAGWPKENPQSCAIEGEKLAGPPIDVGRAQTECRAITDNNMKADCVFDVSVTGFTGFAQTYQFTQKLDPEATETAVKADKDPSTQGENVVFTAAVAQKVSRGGAAPAGAAQFILDGSQIGNPIALDQNGRALWNTSSLQVGQHQIAAKYIPTGWGGVFLASTSPQVGHTVIAASNLYLWLIIALLIIVLIAFIIWRYLRTT